MTKLYSFSVTAEENQPIDYTCFQVKYVGENVGFGTWHKPAYPKLNIHKPSSVDLKDKTVYRYPKLTLPRAKMDTLKEKSNLKVTRDPTKADYKIISKTFITSLLTTSWNDFVSFEKFIDFLKKENYKQDIIDVFDNYNKHDLISTQSSYYNSPAMISSMHTFIKEEGESNYYYVSEEFQKTYDELKISTSLVYDRHMVSLCNEDSVVLTKEEYRNVQSMIKSADVQNRALAVELIANCNLEESLDYVALIYYFLYDYIKEASNWNSVNVKTLRKRLDNFTPYGNAQYGNLYDTFIKKLIEEEYLTQFAFDETARYAFHNVVKRSMVLDKDNVFTMDVSSIKPSEECAKNFKTPQILTKEFN